MLNLCSVRVKTRFTWDVCMYAQTDCATKSVDIYGLFMVNINGRP